MTSRAIELAKKCNLIGNGAEASSLMQNLEAFYRAAYEDGVLACMTHAYGTGDEQMYEQLKGLLK